MQSCSVAAQGTGSKLQFESDKGVYSHNKSREIYRIMRTVFNDHEGNVSIGGRLITNFRFSDDTVVKCRREMGS